MPILARVLSVLRSVLTNPSVGLALVILGHYSVPYFDRYLNPKPKKLPPPPTEAPDLYAPLCRLSKEYLSNELNYPIICSLCDGNITVGPVYLCHGCNFQYLCADCESRLEHDASHVVMKFPTAFVYNTPGYDERVFPAWPLAENVAFRAKFNMIPMLPSSVYKGMIKGTKMTPDECECLYETFKYMVDTPMTVKQVRKSTIVTTVDNEESSSKTVEFFFAVDSTGDTLKHVWGGVSRKTFNKMLPTVETGDKYLEQVLFNMYDLHDDNVVDFYEFVEANLSLFYSTGQMRVARLLRAVQQTEGAVRGVRDEHGDIVGYWLHSSINLSLDRLISALRRVLYAYFDLSRAMFADASSLMAATAESQDTERIMRTRHHGPARPDMSKDPLSRFAEGSNMLVDTRSTAVPVGDALGPEAVLRFAHTRRVEELLQLLREVLTTDRYSARDPAERVAETINRRFPQMSQWLLAVAEAAVL